MLHFCALGYSRPDGQTSDHWADVKNLVWEPEFYRCVRDAFAPVGVAIDAWAETYASAGEQVFPVIIVNDLETPWRGELTFRILRDGRSVWERKRQTEAPGFGTRRETFAVPIPPTPGAYQAEAVLGAAPAGDVRSLRDFDVLTADQIEARRNLAEGCPVKASSVLTADGQTYRAEYAVDGRGDTRWSSEFKDPQWVAVDLGKAQTVSRVGLQWESAFAKTYTVQTSLDGKTWKDVYNTDKGTGGTETVRFAPVEARWVRLDCTERGTRYGYSVWGMGVYH